MSDHQPFQRDDDEIDTGAQIAARSDVIRLRQNLEGTGRAVLEFFSDTLPGESRDPSSFLVTPVGTMTDYTQAFLPVIREISRRKKDLKISVAYNGQVKDHGEVYLRGAGNDHEIRNIGQLYRSLKAGKSPGLCVFEFFAEKGNRFDKGMKSVFGRAAYIPGCGIVRHELKLDIRELGRSGKLDNVKRTILNYGGVVVGAVPELSGDLVLTWKIHSEDQVAPAPAIEALNIPSIKEDMKEGVAVTKTEPITFVQVQPPSVSVMTAPAQMDLF